MFVSPRNCEFMRERKKEAKDCSHAQGFCVCTFDLPQYVLIHGMAVDYASFMAAQRSSRFLPMSIGHCDGGEMRCGVSIDGNCFDENYTLAAVAFVSTFREWRECECRHVLRGNRQTGELTQPICIAIRTPTSSIWDNFIARRLACR